MILVDGARADVFQKLLAAGELPAAKELFADRGGFRRGTTAMPSVSGPAHLPPLTGCYPGRCNIPGIRWFDRARYARGISEPLRFRSYMGPRKRENLNREVSSQVPSVWEQYDRAGAIGCWFTRGLHKDADLTRGAKTRAWLKGVVTRKWEAGDAAAGGRLLQAARDDWPFLFAVFPSVDELGHKGGPLSDASVNAYRAFDRFLPRLRDALGQGRDADRALIMVMSDHGLSTTHTHFDLAGFVRGHVRRLLHFPHVWRHLRDCDAVSMVSGNSLCHLSFRGEDGWAGRPDVSRSGSVAATVVEALLEQPAIDLVVHREGQGLRIRSRRGSASLRRDGGRLFYERTLGGDPMNLPELPPSMTDEESRLLTASSDHPDALVQWEQLFWSERTGDVVVTAAPGWDLRSHFEYQDHRGSHGATWWEHMQVPMLANMALPEDARTVDLLPTALAACGLPIPGGIDGRDLCDSC